MRRGVRALSYWCAGLVSLFASGRCAAQITDVSDSVWSIVVPAAMATDIDMGTVLAGSAKDSVVTAYLTNTGPVPVRIDSIFISGADAAAFALVSGLPPFVIPAGGAKAVEFLFRPQSVALFTASAVTYTQSDTLVRNIRGQCVAPQLELAAALIDFGRVDVNAWKDTTISAIVRNAGGTALTISDVRKLGPDTTQFSVLSGGGAFRLAPGQTRAMSLRFSPVLAGRTSGRIAFDHDGAGSPALLRLFGDGLGTGSATLQLDTVRAASGEAVVIPLYLRNATGVTMCGAAGYRTELRFDASLLSPVGDTPTGLVVDGERTIVLDSLPLLADAEGVLARLRFIATLGSAGGTPLRLANSSGLEGRVQLTEIPGYFLLTDVCREGGSRLFDARGSVALLQNRPNPFNTATVIEYDVIENAPARLVVTDLLGRTVATLADGMLAPGRHRAVFDASAFASGTYVAVLLTPSARLFRLMEVLK